MLYAYEVKYLSRKDNAWHSYTTMLYNDVRGALKDSENFELQIDFSMLTKKLIKKEG